MSRIQGGRKIDLLHIIDSLSIDTFQKKAHQIPVYLYTSPPLGHPSDLNAEILVAPFLRHLDLALLGLVDDFASFHLAIHQ